MARVRVQRLHRAALQLSTEQCVSMTAEDFLIIHISSENVEIFQTKLFRGGQTFLLEIASSSTDNFETKFVKDYDHLELRSEP